MVAIGKKYLYSKTLSQLLLALGEGKGEKKRYGEFLTCRPLFSICKYSLLSMLASIF